MAIVTRSDVEAVVGSANVVKWADLNNNRDAEEIAARIEYCISIAESYVMGKLRLLTYNVADTQLDPLIKHVTAIKAADLLYGPRKTTDAESELDLMKPYRDELKDMLKSIATGAMDLGLTRRSRPYPAVIRSDVEEQKILSSSFIAIITDE